VRVLCFSLFISPSSAPARPVNVQFADTEETLRSQSSARSRISSPRESYLKSLLCSFYRLSRIRDLLFFPCPLIVSYATFEISPLKFHFDPPPLSLSFSCYIMSLDTGRRVASSELVWRILENLSNSLSCDRACVNSLTIIVA